MKRKFFFALIIGLLTFSMLQGKQFNDFTLPDIDNNEVRLADLVGEGIIILDFWATWCQPCMRLMPELDKINQDYEEVQIIGVNVDNPRSMNRAKSLVRSNRYSFQTLYDTNQDVMKKYQVTSIPHTIMIDREGKVVYEHIGYQRGDEKELREKIEEQLEMMKEKEDVDEDVEEKGDEKEE